MAQNEMVTKLDTVVERMSMRAQDLHAACMDNARLASTFVVAIAGGLLAAGLADHQPATWLPILTVICFFVAFAIVIVVVAVARPEVADYEDILRQQKEQHTSDDKTLFVMRYAEREAQRREASRVKLVDILLGVQLVIAAIACVLSVMMLTKVP